MSTFLIRLKPACLRVSPVIASRAEIQGEHLVLLNALGQLAGHYLLENVESLSKLPG